MFGPELEAAALQVEGLEFLDRAAGGRGGPAPTGTSGSPRVELAAWEVPELAEITVVAGPTRSRRGEAPAPPAVPGPPVPVRAPREVC